MYARSNASIIPGIINNTNPTPINNPVNKLINISLKKGDIETALSATNDYILRNMFYPLAWLNRAELISRKTHDYSKAYKVLREGISWNHGNEMLLKKMLYYIMSIDDEQQKVEALQDYSLIKSENYLVKTINLAEERNIKLAIYIMDAGGDPIPGANGFIKGADIGTVSDEKGKLVMNIAKSDVVIVSMEGFEKFVLDFDVISKKGKKNGDGYEMKLIMRKSSDTMSRFFDT